MRRCFIRSVIAVVMIALPAGCSGDKGTAGHITSTQQGVEYVLQNATAVSSEENSSPEITAAEGGTVESGQDGIDVDLTVLSGSMVYSTVFNMVYSPANYIDKTIKMSGTFAYYYDESSGNEYFACIIQDATACCSQGIEFRLAGDLTYPDDYPEVGDEITVIGTFGTYREGANSYCTLLDAYFA